MAKIQVYVPYAQGESVLIEKNRKFQNPRWHKKHVATMKLMKRMKIKSN